MKEKEIKVLMVEPGKAPKVTTIKNELESLQDAVSIGADERGLIEIITISEDVCILCNEEGKLIGLEPNRRLGDDILCGVFYVTGNGEEDLASLSDDLVEEYSKVFEKPESFEDGDVERTIKTLFFPL